MTLYIGKYCIMIKDYTVFADIYFSQILKRVYKIYRNDEVQYEIKRR